MKKQNKRKTKSFKSSILLLLLMAVLLVSSTYAWFTSNQTVTVSTLKVNVQANNGLQISADGTNWKAVLGNGDLTGVTPTYASNVNQIPANMAPVSTTGNIVDGKMDMFAGNVATKEGDTSGTYYLTASKLTDTKGTEGNYIAFDLFLRVEVQTAINLTANSAVKYVGDVDQGLQNAARVAFIVEGNTAVGSALDTIQGLTLNTGSALIWEPNYDTHTAAGVAAARDTYNITTSATGGDLLEYYGVKAAITADESITAQQHSTPSDAKFAKVTPTYSTINGFSTPVSFTTLKTGITKIRVYMWVEGQDVDCENNASGTDITFDLQFTTAA